MYTITIFVISKKVQTYCFLCNDTLPPKKRKTKKIYKNCSIKIVTYYLDKSSFSLPTFFFLYNDLFSQVLWASASGKCEKHLLCKELIILWTHAYPVKCVKCLLCTELKQLHHKIKSRFLSLYAEISELPHECVTAVLSLPEVNKWTNT